MRKKQGQVKVRVDLLEGGDITFGVPVQFRPVTELSEKSADRRSDRSRKLVTAIAPISRDPQHTAMVLLEIGEYDVEAILPTGEQLSAEINVQSNENFEVVLQGSNTSHQQHSGSFWESSNPPFMERIASEKSIFNMDHLISQNLKVTLGGVANSESIGQSFDPSDWDDWYNFILAQYERRDEFPSASLSLHANETGLIIQQEGGINEEPVRISILHKCVPRLDLTDIGLKRVYVSISGSSGSRTFSLPWPWGWTAYRSDSKFFEITARQEKDQLRCAPAFIDSDWGSLFAYMNSGRIHLAAEIVRQAKYALFGKFENPLAAAVGGYILMSSEQGDDADDWPRWLYNLATRFPHFPDGAIIHARWLLRKGGKENIQKAHELLYDSYDRGIPFFTTGIIWLLEGMEQTSIYCDVCTEKLARIRGVARSMDLSQVFTSFTFTQRRRHGSSPTYDDHKPKDAESIAIATDQQKILLSDETALVKAYENLFDLKPKQRLKLPLLRD